MKLVSCACIALLLLVLSISVAIAKPADPAARSPRPTPQPGRLLHSNSTAAGGLAKAATDTFTLFGGAGTLEGKFENGPVPDSQGWMGVDHTDQPVYWQVSTFNAKNLAAHGAGNHAAWSGQTAAQQPSWIHTPGYGNNWDDVLMFRTTLADPSVAQTVSLDFFFNYDTEAGYDFFSVEYDLAGTWTTVYSVSGTNAVAGVFASPGLQYSTLPTAPIVFAGNDYGGTGGDEIRIRLHFTSDGSWSDEDGLQPTMAGAVQVDDISVAWSEGSAFDNFEAGVNFTGAFLPDKAPFVGDFSKVFAKLSDDGLDPCGENRTPVMVFVDDGSTVGGGLCNSACDACWWYPCSTSGQTSPTWNYGTSGGWVINYTGGLTNGQKALNNEVWSPEILWDLPGTADDGADVIGASLRYTMWDHIVFNNGIFPTWAVRSTADGVVWSPWQTSNLLFAINTGPAWHRFDRDFTSLLEPNPVKIQVSLGVVDVADVFGYPGNDATPSPAYDNVSVVKYRVGGPDIRALRKNLAQDGFPVSGSIDASTPAARDALDVPFDAAIDIGEIFMINPGDSVVVTAKTVIPGTTLADLRMVWVLDRNPLFEDALRAAPARTVDENVVTGPTQWQGEVVSQVSTRGAGIVIPDQFFFDLPDVDFLYPGDVLRYYFRATDSDGRVSTLPEDTTGFANGQNYDRDFVVRALPSLADVAGTQPPKLFIDRTSSSASSNAIHQSMRELGFVEGIDYDSYTVVRFAEANGIGATGGHGANAAQLAGYDTIVFDSDRESFLVLGTGILGVTTDKSDDVGVLTAWHALPGPRGMAHFGDSFASGVLNTDAFGIAYVQDVLGVSVSSSDVGAELGGQHSPQFAPVDAAFTSTGSALGGCPYFRRYDSLRAATGAVRGHAFLAPDGSAVPNVAASVIHDRMQGGARKVDLTFPFSLAAVTTPMRKAGTPMLRTQLLQEVFTLLGVPSGSPTGMNHPGLELSMQISPNPFNPRTTIRFAGLPENATGSVRVYSLRGELVATLVDGPLDTDHFTWAGQDSRGRAVASGVYLVRARVGDWSRQAKIALLK